MSKATKRVNFSGQRFGKLIAIKPQRLNKAGVAVWLCVCDCGGIRVVSGNLLSKGQARSCGCLQGNNCNGHRGYNCIWLPKHPRANQWGFVPKHILVAEKTLGKPLPKNATVHHVNKKRADNRHKNLVICQDKAYHNLIHLREKALLSCGNPNWRYCRYCGQWDDPKNMYAEPGLTHYRHIECFQRYQKEWRARKKCRAA